MCLAIAVACPLAVSWIWIFEHRRSCTLSLEWKVCKAEPSYKANAPLNNAQEKDLGMKHLVLCVIMAATTVATVLSPLTYLFLRQSGAGVVCPCLLLPCIGTVASLQRCVHASTLEPLSRANGGVCTPTGGCVTEN